MSSESNAVFLSLGSNLGDREANLRAAVAALQRSLRIIAISSIYETDPVGVSEQPAFLNIVVSAETVDSPSELLQRLKDIEREVGRRPTYRWGPRLIDIDILLYAAQQIETPSLIIPHRELLHRAFVLVPLAEIAGSTVHPVTGMTVAAHRDRLEDGHMVRRVGVFSTSPDA